MFSRIRAVGLLCAVCSALVLNAQTATKQSTSGVLMGSVANGVYRNAALSLSYKIHFGWVDRTTEMRGDPKDAADTSGGTVLLAIFERPPEAIGETVNSAVTIAAESASAYPGLKTAADYFGPVSELTNKMELKALNDPYEITIAGRQLVREDFKKEIGTLTMYWTSLAVLAKGQVVSFTFVASSEPEMEELIGRLSFAAPAKR